MDFTENTTSALCHNCTRNGTNETSANALADAEYIYVILTAVTSGLSIVGGFVTCLLYIILRELRTPGRKLLLFLGVSDGLLATGNLLGIIWYLYCDSSFIHRSVGYCSFQSAMTTYFSMTSFCWTVIIAVCLLKAVVFSDASFTVTYMNVFHLLSWIPPGIIVTTALAMGVLGTDVTLAQASWCWIDPRAPHALVWQFATGKFWEIIAYITTVALYTIVKIYLGRQASRTKMMVSRRKTRQHVIAEANRKLTFVPFVFIVCRIWGTVRFLLGHLAAEHINEPYLTWINPLQGIGDSAQGFANCALYCLSTEKIRQNFVLWFCKCGARTKVATEMHSKAYTGNNASNGISRDQHHATISVVKDSIQPSASVQCVGGETGNLNHSQHESTRTNDVEMAPVPEN